MMIIGENPGLGEPGCPGCGGTGAVVTADRSRYPRPMIETRLCECVPDVFAPPWERANDHGELPGDICCQRATGPRCFDHDPASYK